MSNIWNQSYQIENLILINLIEHKVSEKVVFLRSEKTIASGDVYIYSKVYAGSVKIEATGKKEEVRFNRRLLRTLDENDNSKKQVKDRVFKDYTGIIKAKAISIFVSIFMFLVALGCGACIYFFLNDKILFPVFIIASGVALIISLVLLILHFSWRRVLKKRKLRIDSD